MSDDRHPSVSTPYRCDLVHVAAAALIDGQGRVLLTRRHDESHQGGLWEFPGGKIEPGESVADGLARELHEELGIRVAAHRPLIRVIHHYPDRSVLLDVHRVEAWQGEPRGLEGQPLAWVEPANLGDYPMPQADVPIVNALQLPSTYLITPPALGRPEVFLRALEGSLSAGIGLVQLRLFGLDDAELRVIGREACALCHAQGARVLLNGEPAMAATIGADGIHLNSTGLQVAAGRSVGSNQLLAASCHSAADLEKAASVGADFAVLSPVLPTRSHPDADPLGWEAFGAAADEAALPVYALGGMHPGLLETAWRFGAQGIAGIRGLWAGSLD